MRVMASEYQAYITARGQLDKRFLECPFRCDHSERVYDVERTEACDKCPVRKRRRSFEADVSEAWSAMLGPEHGFVFSQMEDELHTIHGLSRLGDRILYRNHLVLSVIRSMVKDG